MSAYSQVDGQLMGGMDVPCEVPSSKGGKPQELNPLELFPTNDKRLEEQMSLCFTFRCINGKVEVVNKWINYVCDKPQSDTEWVRYVEQAPLREQGPRRWRWQVPARIWELVRQQSGSPAGDAAPLASMLMSSLSTASTAIPTTAKPVTSPTTPSTTSTSTTTKPITSSTRSPISHLRPRSSQDPDSDYEGLKPYVPKKLDIYKPNPKWTKDLSALDVDYDELDDDEPTRKTESVDNSQQETSSEESTTNEEEQDELETTTITTTTTTQRPTTRLTTTTTTTQKPSTRVTTSRRPVTRETSTSPPPTNVDTTFAPSTRIVYSQPQASSTIPPSIFIDQPIFHFKRLPSARVPARMPIAHNFLDDHVKVEASTHEDASISNPMLWDHVIRVIICTGVVLVILYSSYTIIKVMAWAAQEYLRNKWTKEVPPPADTKINTTPMRGNVFNLDV